MISSPSPIYHHHKEMIELLHMLMYSEGAVAEKLEHTRGLWSSNEHTSLGGWKI